MYNMYILVTLMSLTTSNIARSLKFGPSGRAMSHPMDSDLLENFYLHLTMERSASVEYFSLSLWFEQMDLHGFSKYFIEESKNENKHALLMSKYLISRGQSIKLYDLPAPKQKWISIEECISDSFLIESDITTSLHQLYSLSELSSDERTSVFLDQFMEEQIKSEDEIAHLLGQVRFCKEDPSSILLIDKDLG